MKRINRPTQGAIADLAERVTGGADGLDNAEIVVVGQIMAYVTSRPALGKMDRIGLTAIAALSEENPDLARSLMTELLNG